MNILGKFGPYSCESRSQNLDGMAGDRAYRIRSASKSGVRDSKAVSGNAANGGLSVVPDQGGESRLSVGNPQVIAAWLAIVGSWLIALLKCPTYLI